VPGSCGESRSSGAAKGVFSSVFCGAAGTGPGIEGDVEKMGRASSRNENVGTADESNALSAPGMADAGGCEAGANSSSGRREEGMVA
jgi:hypothetical protein